MDTEPGRELLGDRKMIDNSTLVTGEWIARGKAPQPYNRRSVLGKSQIATARRWLLLNTKWWDSIRNGKRPIMWDLRKGERDLRNCGKCLFPISVPKVDNRSERTPTSASRRRPGDVKYM